MIVRLACGALQGVDAFRLHLEVDFLRKGMPAFVMVGLAEGAVREAKERVLDVYKRQGSSSVTTKRASARLKTSRARSLP